MKFIPISLFFLTAFINNLACAEGMMVVGFTPHTLKQNDPEAALGMHDKVIQLLRVKRSDEQKKLLALRAQDAKKHVRAFSEHPLNAEALPKKVQLGMNQVRVLDQGIHGTCVTFAVTGALDAAIGKGDYISQLCNLQLGTYLEKHGYGVSGWDGSDAQIVIDQIEQFGVVNKQKQKTIGCGGWTRYPAYRSYDPESFIEPEQYRSMSELVFGNTVNWLDVFESENPMQTFTNVKEALVAEDRVVFGILLPHSELGVAGAVGNHKTKILQDTWLLTPEILKDIEDAEDGHEMIITGYDDDAIAVDDKGVQHKGLFTLRNSWGSWMGYYGNFYMSYDYFKLLSMEVMRLQNINRP